MGGIFGAVSKRDITADLFFGIDYHTHLGARRGGMAVYDLEDGFQRAIHNIESAPFRTKAPRGAPIKKSSRHARAWANFLRSSMLVRRR